MQKQVGMNYADKIALAAGSLALLPMGAGAGIIYHPGGIGPVSVSNPSMLWDVDSGSANNNGAEFSLWIHVSTFSGSPYAAAGFMDSSSHNARGLVQTGSQVSDAFQKLATGFAVGPTFGTGYRWDAAGQTFRTIFAGSNVGYDASIGDFVGGGNEYFGFRFTDGTGGLFYGWANLRIDPGNREFSITEWAYNDTPNGAICVGETSGPGGVGCAAAAIPEPGTLSLALLGLGAGGVRAWRGRKAAQALAA